MTQVEAFEKLRSGEIAATVLIAGKPARSMAGVKTADRLDVMYGTCNARAIFEGDGSAVVRGKDVRVSSCSMRQGNVLVGGEGSATAPTTRRPPDPKQYYRSDKN